MNKLLNEKQLRNYNAMLYLHKVNPDKFVYTFHRGKLTLMEIELHSIGTSQIEIPIKHFDVDTK